MTGRCLGLALVCLGVAASAHAQETPYFPTRLRSEWAYHTPAGPVVIEARAAEKFNNLDCIRLEASVRGVTLFTEHIQIKQDGVYRVAQNGIPVEPPYRFIKLPPKKGDSFEVNSMIAMQSVKGVYQVSFEDVVVGELDNKKFYPNCLKISTEDMDIAGVKTRIVTWYAENVGMVKQIVDLGERKLEYHLAEYRPAK